MTVVLVTEPPGSTSKVAAGPRSVPTTPVKSKSINPESSNISSTHVSHSSAQQPDPNPLKQEELMRILQLELRDAVYVFPPKTLITHYFPAGASLGDSVHDSIFKTKTRNPLKQFHWSASTAEAPHYEPFCLLLNTILSTCHAKQESSYHANLRFFEYYDKQVDERVDGAAKLKPDLVGLHMENPNQNLDSKLQTNVQWHDIRVVAEVKSSWSELMWQTGTYARAMLSDPGRRVFVVGIMLNHSTSTARVAIFHRGGVHTTDPMALKEKEGLKQFVGCVAGIYSCKDACEAGLDTTRSWMGGYKNYAVVLPDGSHWQAQQSLVSRNCVHGRATRVDIIIPYVDSSKSPTTDLAQISLPSVAPTAPKVAGRVTRSQAVVQQSVPSAGGVNAGKRKAKDDGGNDTLSKRQKVSRISFRHRSKTQQGNFRKLLAEPPHELPSLPGEPQATTSLFSQCKRVVLKDSWPLKDRNNEGAVFEDAKGCFGVQDVLQTYAVCDEKGEQTTSRLLSNKDGKLWRIEKEQSENTTAHSADVSPPPPDEERVHMRSVIATVGKPLNEAASLYDLFKTILHAIMGHYNLFKKGWLHRDVSYGNVMICDATEKPAVTSLGEKVKTATEENCIGIISDGDHSTPVEPKDKTNSADRSGTLPFLAKRLLEVWENKGVIVHTAMDDLESFLWLMIWCILHRAKRAGDSNGGDGLEPREEKWLKNLTIWDSVADCKRSINNAIHEGWRHEFSPDMALALPLLKKLAELSLEGRNKIKYEIMENTMTVERHKGLAEEYYRQYAEAIIDFLPTLKQ